MGAREPVRQASGFTLQTAFWLVAAGWWLVTIIGLWLTGLGGLEAAALALYVVGIVVSWAYERELGRV